MYTPMITKPGTQAASGGGTGDVEGPASSTDNAVARFDGTTGKLLQDTANATLSDEGYLTAAKLYSYNAFTNTSNYERFAVSWGSNLLTIGTEAAGTGTARDMELNVGGSKLRVKTDGTIYLDAAGQTVGNARGAGAVDLSATRNGATKVASGAGSFTAGQYTTASAVASTALGYGSIASGVSSFACNSQTTASGSSSFSSGLNAVASGYASTAMGSTNLASASYSFAVGEACTASGISSSAIGAASIASNYYSLALNYYSNAANVSQIAFGLGPALGQAQGNLQTLYKTTSDATSTILDITGNGANRIVIPAKRACTITGLITAYSDATDGYKVASWEIKCVIERNASNVTRIIGTPVINPLGADTDAAGWAVTNVTADDTNEALAITVTGEAATNIRWQGSLFYGQVGYA
jgi:hypothetical protein